MRPFNNTIQNLETAVKERVFFVKNDEGDFVPPPLPDEVGFGRLNEVKKALFKTLPSTSPLSYSDFVATFRGRKRVLYERAVKSLLGRSLTRRDSHVKAFVKYEKTNYAKKRQVPRVISPRDPRYNVEVGRYIRPIEERVFKCLGLLFGDKTVFKGVNALESGRLLRKKWESFKDPCAVGLDASRFDQHCSTAALRFEHDVYEACFPLSSDKRRLARLLSWQLENHCAGYCPDGKLKYTTEGGRMSGDMNTSLGNCLLMCCMIKAYADSRGIVVKLANNGDDCVVVLERSDLQKFSNGLKEYFLGLGYNMVVEDPVFEFERIDFCQTQPVYLGPGPGDYIMTRHPRDGVAKDCVALHHYHNRKMFLGWVKAVGAGGLSMSGGIPILQNFYALFDRSGVTWKNVEKQTYGRMQSQRGMSQVFTEPSPKTRASFYLAYGIAPDAQRAIERYYDESTLDFDVEIREPMRHQRLLPY